MNDPKCHLLLSSVEYHTTEINEFTLKNSHCEKLLGIHFDDQWQIDFHIDKLCKDANKVTCVNMSDPLHGRVKEMNLN